MSFDEDAVHNEVRGLVMSAVKSIGMHVSRTEFSCALVKCRVRLYGIKVKSSFCKRDDTIGSYKWHQSICARSLKTKRL